MRKFKKIFNSILIIVMTMMIITPTNAYASDNSELTKNTKDKVITNSEEIKEYCNQKQIPFIEDGKEISKIVIVEEIRDKKTALSQITTRALGDIYTTEYPIEWTGSKYCAISSGKGPCVLGLSSSYSEAATVSASFSYSASDLSAIVGFSVTNSYTISPTYSVNLSSGQNATIYAYPIYNGYLFKKVNILTGSVNYGKTYRPIGASYDVVYR